MKNSCALALAAAILYAAPPADAHHGAEFSALEGFDIGHPGDGYLLGTFDWERYGGIDELSSELSLFFSPVRRIGIGADVRFAESGGGSWDFSGVTPKVQIQLTDPASEFPVKFSLSVGYQFARDLSDERTVTTYEDVVTYQEVPAEPRTVTVPATDPGGGGGGGDGPPACDPLFDLDCLPADKSGKKPSAPEKHTGSHAVATTTTTVTTRQESTRKRTVQRVATTTTYRDAPHSGIHNHDTNQWMGRLTAQAMVGRVKVVGNLIATLPEGDAANWGYGVGALCPLTDSLSAGLEAVGDFGGGGEHQAIASLVQEVGAQFVVRGGIGVGLTGDSPDMTARVGLLWRF
ncbi:MAG: hypothetical protein R3F11_10855 [Verrucomicrobiales bacterium]